MRNNRKLACIVCILLASTAQADGLRERFTDPQDGQFDMSNWLLDHRGAFPFPIVITEPAIGYGGGLALAWFSESIGDAAKRAQETGGRIAPPDIYAVAAFGTENGTKGAGVGARLSFLDDTVRYRGFAGDISVNLDFYGEGGGPVPGFKIGYNIDGVATFQELAYRLGNTDQFLGARLLYTDLNTSLNLGNGGEDGGLTPKQFAKRSSGLGVTYVYDSRDNIFATKKGIDASIDGMFYSPSIGSDTAFQAYRAHIFDYNPVGDTVVVALRADYRTARGDVPFYQLPFIDMRGIPAARYQDQNTSVLEAEVRYYAAPRWIVLGFAGVGRAWGSKTNFSGADNQSAGGVGFRYVVARRLGLAVGIDVARGPEDTAWYLQVGNSWR